MVQTTDGGSVQSRACALALRGGRAACWSQTTGLERHTKPRPWFHWSPSKWWSNLDLLPPHVVLVEMKYGSCRLQINTCVL